MTKEWKFLAQGRNRSVYRRDNYVVKVPLSDYGLSDNWHEAQLFRKWGQDPDKTFIPYARCRMVGVLLVMEYARYRGPLSDETGYIPHENLPNWASYVDCQQVGYNRAGKLVAYDFGLH